MPTPDGHIGSRDLCSGAVIERTIADGGVSSLKISATLQSDNFASGSAGWQINRVTGSAEFQDGVFRGSLNANDIDTGYIDAAVIDVRNLNATELKSGSIHADRIATTSLNADNISAGSLSANYISGGSISGNDVTITNLNASNIDAGTMAANYLGSGTTGSITITLGTSGKIQSNDSDPDVVINGNGSATFKNVTITGTVYATSGTLSGLSVTGQLQLSGSGKLVTATSGNRIEITAVNDDRISFITGLPNESTAASIIAHEVLSYPSLYLRGPNSDSYIQLNSGPGSQAAALMQADSTVKLQGSSANITVTSSGLYSSSYIRGQYGSVTYPGISFYNSTGAGLYNTGSFCGIAYGGSAICVGNGADQLYLGGMANFVGSGELRYSATRIGYWASSRRFKKNIRPIADDLAALVDTILDWEPVTYEFIDGIDGEVNVGWIAEDIYDASGELMIRRDEDGEIHNNDTHAQQVLIVEKIKQLDRRIAALEAA